MSEFWRRHMEEQERMRRLLEPTSYASELLARAQEQITGSPALRYAQEEAERQRQIIRDAVGPSFADQALEAEINRYRQLAKGSFEEAALSGLYGRGHIADEILASDRSFRPEFKDHFRRPDTSELSRLAVEGLAGSHFNQSYAVAESALAGLMGKVESSWLNVAETARSTQALADLAGIGFGLRTVDPYSTGFVAALRPSLGDWRDEISTPREILIDPMLRTGLYRERGVDLTLTEFPVVAFEQSARAGGLLDDDDDIGGDDDAARASVAFDRLRRFEVEIRRFIVRVMEAAFGDSWMRHQLPPGMLERWREKQAQAVKTGEAELPLIDYADFSDYRLIIERSDNWKLVFKPVFGRAEDVRESLQRLQPIRIATMHARIVTLDDVLLLHVETRRILKVAKVRAG